MELPEGYTPCPGNRAPSVKRWGDRVMVVLRCGIQSGPWDIRTTRWTFEDHPGDVIGIRRVD